MLSTSGGRRQEHETTRAMRGTVLLETPGVRLRAELPMCLAVVALDSHSLYPLVVIANRDEYHDRPTAAAHWWDEGWVAGRDLRAGGTWLGITRSGRFALLTNVRDPARNDPQAPSRGTLVPEVLADAARIVATLDRVRAIGVHHNGFNLLAGTIEGAAWTSNRAVETKSLRRGVWGLSNALLDAPWPKVVRTKAALSAWLARSEASTEPLFDALADRALATDADLPATGVALEWERRLSAPFIVSASYGTRSSTVITIDTAGEACFVERSFDPRGVMTGEAVHRFAIDRSQPRSQAPRAARA